MKINISVYQPRKEDIYNWCGAQLYADARDYITVNNIVRIQIQFFIKKSPCFEAVYVEIVSIDENDIFTGVVLDTYRQFSDGETLYAANGDRVRFARSSVIEIPHTWEGNENLVIVENMTTGLGRSITGILS